MREHRRIALLTRMKASDGTTLCFTTPRKTRGRPTDFIPTEHVPHFEGDSATFEIVSQRVPDSPWPHWVVVRRVDL